jgi:hypothetical protein
MADGTIGNAAIDRSNTVNADYTILNYNSPATKSGKLYKVDIFTAAIYSPCNAKIKVFREVGANFVQVGADYAITSAAASGLNTYTLTTPIAILAGDYIAWWSVYPGDVCYIDRDASGGSCYFYAGEVTGTLAKASWTANEWIPSIYGYIQVPSGAAFLYTMI